MHFSKLNFPISLFFLLCLFMMVKFIFRRMFIHFLLFFSFAFLLNKYTLVVIVTSLFTICNFKKYFFFANNVICLFRIGRKKKKDEEKHVDIHICVVITYKLFFKLPYEQFLFINTVVTFDLILHNF